MHAPNHDVLVYFYCGLLSNNSKKNILSWKKKKNPIHGVHVFLVVTVLYIANKDVQIQFSQSNWSQMNILYWCFSLFLHGRSKFFEHQAFQLYPSINLDSLSISHWVNMTWLGVKCILLFKLFLNFYTTYLSFTLSVPCGRNLSVDWE